MIENLLPDSVITKVEHRQECALLCFAFSCDRTREKGSGFVRGGSGWPLGGLSSQKGLSKNWDRFPREMESPSRKVFKERLDMALGVMVYLTRWCLVEGWA